MKKTLLIMTALLMVLNVWAQDVIVERPSFRVTNQTFLEVEKIIISDTATVVKMVGYHHPGWWIKVIADTYIEAEGKKYVLKYADNIVLGDETYTNDQGEHHFTLIFDPIPKNTKKITLVEDKSIIKDIDLQSKIAIRDIDIPSEFLVSINNLKDDGKSLPIPQYIDGKAILKGKFGDYIPDMNVKVEIYVNNTLTREQEKYTFAVNGDGTFVCEIPITHSMQILFKTSNINNWVVVSPNKESCIYIDLYQQSRQNARLRTDKSIKSKYIYFSGENAELNNQYFSPKYNDFDKKYRVDYGQMLSDISGMNFIEYKNYHLNKMQTALQALEGMGFTKKMTEFASITTKLSTFYWLSMGDYFLKDAFRKANNLDYKSKLVGYTEPDLPDDYFDIIKDISVNDPKSLYSNEYGNTVSSCGRLKSSMGAVSILYLTDDILKEIEAKGDLSADDKDVLAHMRKYELYENWSADSFHQIIVGNQSILQKMLDSELLKPAQEKTVNKMLNLSDFDTPQKINSYMEGLMTLNNLVQRDSLFQKLEFPHFTYNLYHVSFKDSIFQTKRESFHKKHKDYFEGYYTKQRLGKSVQPITEILGTDKGILFDLLICQSYYSNIEKYTPLSKSDLAILDELDNPFYASYITRLNNELIAKIEEDKNNPYNAYTLPETDEDKILHEIIKPFDGKVILLDFWATWCGPCLSAMKQFADTKKSFADKDVVFIYLTDYTSPESTWNNMIPSIGGEHYRLTDEQFVYLQKKFGSTGVPSYLILNRKGEKVYFRVGFEGADVIAKKLNEELDKQP